VVDKKNSEQWYSPKELHAMILELKDALQETTAVIKKYNCLRERMGDMDATQKMQAREIIIIQADEVKTRAIAEAQKHTKDTIADYLIKLWPLIIMTIIFILTIYRGLF